MTFINLIIKSGNYSLFTCYGDKEIIFFEEVEEISEAGNNKTRVENSLISSSVYWKENWKLVNHTVYAEILHDFRNKDELPSPNYFVQHSNPAVSQVATDVIL